VGTHFIYRQHARVGKPIRSVTGELKMSRKKQGASASTDNTTEQTTLFTFGGGATQDGNDFINVSEQVKNLGDTLTFTMDSATYNADKACLTVFNGEGQAIGIHQNHSPAMLAHASEQGWTLGKTDGDRFADAAEAAGMITSATSEDTSDEAWENISANINAHGATLMVTMIETKGGHNFRRWTVNFTA
jgi:hypothetical protein